ncbi:MAG: hypothetical protein ABI373_11025 [Flavobacteriales bacterium]
MPARWALQVRSGLLEILDRLAQPALPVLLALRVLPAQQEPMVQ